MLVLIALAVCCQAYKYSGSTTVSGLSAGGFFAVQMHVAFSRSINGSAIFAGGPYFCSNGVLETALTACMSDPFLIVTDELIAAAEVFAAAGLIDPLDGLKGDPVFLYSGTKDSVVHPDVVHKTGDFYSAFGAVVTKQFNISSEHCQPTIDFGNACATLDEPYISKCEFDGAGVALQQILGPLAPRGQYISANLKTIDLDKFFSVPIVPGLAKKGFVYVPTSCQNGESCGIHLSLHGCNQNYDSVGLQYVEHSGYLPWAESNNLIVLFPQTEKTDIPYNPQACFEWWSFSPNGVPLPIEKDVFATKKGLQMSTLFNLIEAVKNSSFSF